MTEFLRIDRQGSVTTVWIDRQAKMNALTVAMRETFPGIFRDADSDEAVRVVVETNQASVTILQRRLRLGDARAARLVDMMEQNGFVCPYAGSKARDILVVREQWLLENMQNHGGTKILR